ncbi:NuA4 histone H4 acetyltransferase complex and the SWR1 complex subunit [Metarhizium acridum]|uniref:NuA4 histone H4 acetyltransferase complex and the SWR1 complex subunit n=1 Tax=Metarhizium acridum TaxID=92637 RepID=UPI001C6B1E1F|nr:NuA4 histone H4 acetyltransferase complex and the SWR1 complex subunit [Metarhizium acridum]
MAGVRERPGRHRHHVLGAPCSVQAARIDSQLRAEYGLLTRVWLSKKTQPSMELDANKPNTVVEGEQGKPFVVNETGWGEFDITIKLYYVNDSGEKPQTMYHYLRLHPFGRTEEEKQSMVTKNGEVRSWSYEEQLFNEPYEAFFQILTSGAVPKGWKPSGASGKGKGKNRAPPPLPAPDSGEVWEHTAMIPNHNRPGQPFSRETEAAEVRRLKEAQAKTEEMCAQILSELKAKEELLAKLKAENQAAAAAAAAKPA